MFSFIPVEKAYGLMKSTNDLTRLPAGFDLEDGDRDSILEQAVILRNAGFQSPIVVGGAAAVADHKKKVLGIKPSKPVAKVGTQYIH